MLMEKSGLDRGFDVSAVELAMNVLRARVEQLPAQDQRDARELIGILITTEDDAERVEARAALLEVLVARQTRVRPLDIEKNLAPSLNTYAAHVGGKIRELRKISGMTQEELATKAGILQSYISRLETDSHSPSHRTLEKIAAALGVPVTDIDPSCEIEGEE